MGAAGKSVTGLLRKNNEDTIYISNEESRIKNLYIVADGMGGHKAGEIASRICVENLAAAETILHRYNSIKEAVAYLQTVIANINDVCMI